jgi:hypothetical protein
LVNRESCGGFKISKGAAFHKDLQGCISKDHQIDSIIDFEAARCSIHRGMQLYLLCDADDSLLWAFLFN